MNENKDQAKVHISLRDGILELQGSEAFVSGQLKFLEPLIKEAFKSSSAPAAGAGISGVERKQNVPGVSNSEGLTEYETLFADADGKVQILKSLPGSNKAAKSVNAALLLAFANTLKGVDATPFSDVRDLCASHACLDSSNFASTMKAQREHFIVSGPSSSQAIKLTVPGKTKAKSLADELK